MSKILYFDGSSKTKNYAAYGLINGYLMRDMKFKTPSFGPLVETTDKNTEIAIAGEDKVGLQKAYEAVGLKVTIIADEDVTYPMTLSKSQIVKLRKEEQTIALEKQKAIASAKLQKQMEANRATSEAKTATTEALTQENASNASESLKTTEEKPVTSMSDVIDFTELSKRELKHYVTENDLNIDTTQNKAGIVADILAIEPTG